MVRISHMEGSGLKSRPFALPDPLDKIITLGDFSDAPALLAACIRSHCAFVLHLIDPFASFASAGCSMKWRADRKPSWA